MKRLFSRICALGLIMLFALSAIVFAACEPKPEEPELLVYSVTVVNENDEPVSGVKVKFGNFTQTTDANGKASIELEPKEYKITLSALPEGYTYSAEITLTPELSQVKATLVKGDGEPDPIIPVDPDADRTYTVTVLYEDGKPVSGVSVQLCSDSGCKLPVTVNAQGKASLLTSPDNYHVLLNNLPEGYTYAPKDNEGYYRGEELTPTKLAITITIFKPENTLLTVKNTDEETHTVTVKGTEYYAELEFQPKQSGVYSISSDTQIYDAKIGYYPFRHSSVGWDQLSEDDRNDNVSATDKNFRYTVSVKPEELFTTDGKIAEGAVWVFRIYVNAANANGTNAAFPAKFDIKIRREGDVQVKPSPVYRDAEITAELSKFGDMEGTLTEVAMDGSANLVYNEEDGFYHLNAANGPVVTVKLSSTPRYYDRALINIDKVIGNLSGSSAVYRFDITPESDKDDITKPIVYLDYRMMLRGTRDPLTTDTAPGGYAAQVNKDGVYGLTKDLEEFLKRFASSYDAKDNIGTKDPNAEEESYWLFACYYYDTSASNPA